eukprot:5794491-Ditylum_brightwellii.AAC.1
MSKPKFLTECLTVRKKETTKTNESFEIYDINHVRKLVHVIRNPFDNVVSRFRNRYNHMNEGEKLLYPMNPSGFRKFCHDYVDHHDLKEQEFDSPINKIIWSSIESVPCHTDFLRYIIWHNHAFEVARDAGLPTMEIQYEQYGHHWNKTVTDLLEFLEQPILANLSRPFRKIEGYGFYFENKEMAQIKLVFERLASGHTWSSIAHYFKTIPDDHKYATPDFASESAMSSSTVVTEAPAIMSQITATPLYVAASDTEETHQEDIRCSYEMLHRAFAERETSNINESHCWRVENEAPMIPLDSIVNFNSAGVLGIGSNGIVHKASILLDKN